MQMIAAVICGKQAIWMLGVADDCIEVNHPIEVSCGANPLIDGLAVSFAERSGMVVIGAEVRSDRSPKDTQAVSVSTDDDLLVRVDHSRVERCVLSRGHFTVAR